MTKKSKNKNKQKDKHNYIYLPPKEEYYHNSNFNLIIKPSNIHNSGKGVFTLDFIPSNTFIDYYEGIVMNYLSCGSYFLKICDNYGIDAQIFPRCYMAMINDTFGSNYHHNCKFIINKNKLNDDDNDSDSKYNVEVWSIKDILKDEELYISYGDEYW